ncbi:TRAP transporter substrate-binding protein [Haliea sp. E17]|uniref:TRAP transporter substrate-binding protein n=1 Tax=Haliea sp. E17 TaxID=3401576 RepID=UPI003AAE2185
MPALAACGIRGADALRLKLAHGLDTNHPVHKAMVYMGEVLSEQSGGAMQLDIHPAGQLGAERDLIELLQVGSIALTKVSASPLESFAPAMKIFSVPYVFRDAAHFQRFLDSEHGRALLLSLEQVRLRGLAYYDAGSRSFYTTHQPVHTPADLAGLKIRVQKSKTSVQMIQALGAAATPIAWAELYTALQQGIVDGAENNPPSFYLSRHFEVARYFSLDEHTFVPDVLMVSRHVWQSLSPPQQTWLQAAADASAQYERELWRVATQEAMAAVKSAGVEIIHPDKAAFRAAVEPMYAAWGGTPLGDLLSTIRGMP